MKDYDHKIDCWSLGCIMADMLKLTPTYAYTREKLEIGANHDEKYLFEGNSCYPLSPMGETCIMGNKEKCPYGPRD